MNKKVSIIMGIYNCEETISECIDSIREQTYSNWELIMCDDSSKDNTYDIAYGYTEVDKRIVLIRNENNIGLAETLNNCLLHSTGIYIMRHDADDIMLVNRIEMQVNYMESNDCDACGTGAYLFDDSGVWGIRQLDRIPTKNVMISGAPFIHPTVMMKHKRLLEVGGYSNTNITKQRLEDFDLWTKFYEKDFLLHNIQMPLIYFRENKHSYKRKSKRFRLAETRARLDACKRLKIPYVKRIFALKPLIVMLIPKNSLRKYHIWIARRNKMNTNS